MRSIRGETPPHTRTRLIRITMEREKRGLSKAALARLANINAGTLSLIELEWMKPSKANC